MSTPISRDNKLQGLELYAPRRARTQFLPEDQAAAASMPPDPENNQAHASEDDPWWDPAEAANARTRVNDAMPEATEPPFDDPEPAPPTVSSPQSSPPLSAEGETIDWPPPSSDLRRSGSGRAGTISRRHWRLDPDIVPEPPAGPPRRAVFVMLARFSLVVGFAAILAYGVTMISSGPDAHWLKRKGVDMAAIAPSSQSAGSEPREPPRLVVEDQQVFANEPLPLGISTAHARRNSSLLLHGLVKGTRLSAGASTSASDWRLSIGDLRGLYLYAPKNFVGVMNTGVDLVAPDRQLVDSRAVQLKWVAKEPAPVSALTSAPPSDRTELGSSRAPAVHPIDPSEAAVLIDRSQEFLKAGDIEAARIGLGRLADAGNADAALTLAATYDPRYLAKHNVIGVRGDAAKARAFYQRAVELGSTEAGRILAQMAQK